MPMGGEIIRKPDPLTISFFSASSATRGITIARSALPFRTNFRKFFVTYLVVSLICVSLVVTGLKAVGIAVLGLRWGSEQIEESFDQQIEKVKEHAERDSTFRLR